MTTEAEDKLFEAIDEYAAEIEFMSDTGETRAKLLQVIEEYSRRLVFQEMHPNYQLLLAEAAVGRAYMRACDATTDWESMVVDQLARKQLSDAVKSLRELEASNAK